jgi:hypothetical protein
MLHYIIGGPEAHNTCMVRKRRSVEKQSYDAAKGSILDYHVVKEVEQESDRVYRMKSWGIEGKQIVWFPPAILSQSELKFGSKYVLLCKGFDALKGGGDINECPTAQEEPVGV